MAFWASTVQAIEQSKWIYTVIFSPLLVFIWDSDTSADKPLVGKDYTMSL